MLQTVLIVLTLGHADGAHLSLTRADDAAACAQKSEGLAKILSDAGYTVGARRCIETDLRFTPYQPGATEMPHRFKVTLPQTGAEVQALASGDDCTAAPDGQPQVVCAVSAQQVLRD